MKDKFSIVVPVYGNEANIPVTVPYMVDNLSLFKEYSVEILLICDGSPDRSYDEMIKVKERYPDLVTIVKLTRNFGQGAAIHCGVELSTGDVIGVISCDMQDPFELFVDMLNEWRNGYKLVIASRVKREETGIGAFGSRILHKLIHKFISKDYPTGGFDFFLMDRMVADQFCNADIANGSIQLLLMWLGYDFKTVEYTRRKRELGISTYKLSRKMEIASGIFASYTSIFTRSWGIIGCALCLASLLILPLIAIIGHMPAFEFAMSAVICSIFFSTGLILVAIASAGEHAWRTQYSTAKRPRYVIDDIR